MLPVWLALFQFGFAQEPLISTNYDQGAVIFYLEKGDGLGSRYNLTGRIEVQVFENWVRVFMVKENGEREPDRNWILPRERVVYIGEEFD